MLHLILEAPAGSNPLGGYFCNDDPATGYLPHFRFGSTASAAVQALAKGDEIDLGIEDGLRSYPGRVLILTGACNRYIGEAHQRRFHLGLFQHASLEVVPGAGHTMLGEAPEVSTAIIRRFLASG